MTAKQRAEMRSNGATYQQIADVCGISKQAAHQSVTLYEQKIKKKTRGKGFSLEKIKYKGIYEHFVANESETLSSFVFGVYGDRVHATKMGQFLRGEHDSYFKIAHIKKMCDICGKTFEETFAVRDIPQKEGVG